MLKPWRTTGTHEELFIERYEQLLRWSLKLTAHDRQFAEDLVHDVFIHFTLVRPDLDGIQNVEGYLYTMLRNRHLSIVRRNNRHPVETLSMVDYDSAEIGLRAADPRDQIKVRDELRAICRYACVRKDTSKAGSVLILRFFLGYYPAEIAALMKITRQAVDIWLRMARTEARTYLEDPGNIRFLKNALPHVAQTRAAEERDLASELRMQIFSSHNGECLDDKQLKQLYGLEQDAVPSETLAHIVSCEKCLGAIAAMLGLAGPTDRHPTDSIGPDPGKGPSRPLSAPAVDRVKRSRLRAKEVFEHSPRKLCVSANGFFIGSQNISSSISELTLSINIAEELGFLEISSEQDISLLEMPVEAPPGGSVEQFSRVHLSEGRALEATVSFSAAWPQLQVVYRDPLLQEIPQDEVPREDVSTAIRPPASRVKENNAFERVAGGMRPWLRRLGSLGFWLRPGVVTGTVAVLAAAAVLISQTLTPQVSAAELLTRAATSEANINRIPGLVRHRTLALEVRNVSTEQPASRHRVEVWQSASPIKGNLRARRLYDETGRLLAGEWTRADGSQTVYTAVSPTSIHSSTGTRDLWRLEPSAESFTRLVGRTQDGKVDESPDSYIVSFLEGFASDRPDGLVTASLRIRTADLHATEQTLVVRLEADLLEFRFIETAVEHNSPTNISPAVFEPEPELIGVTNPPRVPSAGQGTPAISSTEGVASADLEIEVAYLLDRVNANLGEQVMLSRMDTGKLLVQGVVESEKRRTEILTGLAPVMKNPAVKIDVITVSEALKRQKDISATGRRIEVDQDSLPESVGAVRAYLSGRGVSSDRLDEEVRRYCDRILSLSRNSLKHAWALKRLSEQFRPEHLQTAGLEARAKRAQMVREHAMAVAGGIEKLRLELQPVFDASTGSLPPQSEIKNEADLARAISELADMASVVDRAVRSGFTISTAGAADRGINTPAFRQSLRIIESLVQEIKMGLQRIDRR